VRRWEVADAFAKDSPVLRKNSIAIVIFGIFLLCFMWVGLYYKIAAERRMEINSAIRETGNFARAFEEHTLRTIKSADQTALFLKYQYEKSGTKINIPQYIKEGRLLSEPFVLLSVMDEHGDLKVSSQVPFVPSNLKDREHFLVHKDRDTGKLFISKPVLGRSSGKWSLQMTRRVNKPDGSFGGVVVVSVDPYYFTKFYKQVNLGKDPSILLVGKDGIVRAGRSGQEDVVGRDINHSLLMQKLNDGPAGSFIVPSPETGDKRIYSYRTLSDYPLIVAVGVDEADVLRNFYQRVVGYCLFMAVGTILILGFIFMLLSFMVRQKHAALALKQANDNLETKVEMRTQELTRKNVELRVAYQELKDIQSQSIQQEKMASIGQLAAGVAHELNHPLALVISNLGVLQNYLAETAGHVDSAADRGVSDTLAEANAVLTKSIEGAARVKQIVEALKKFSRKEVDECYPANINEGLESAVTLVRNEFKYKASLVQELNSLPLTCCRIGQLSQSFMNLLLNAAQAIELQGEIHIKSWTEEDNIFVSIADTGVGIAPENIDRIFEPFFSTGEAGRGTGLGLSIAYEIIRQHNGEITVESEVGKGSTFTIKIPVMRK
jgi:signal transduction histidine kinase